MTAKVAALFVEESGVYAGLPDVDIWGISRDARKYDGNHPVVAHPPCERWGRYWSGGPSAKVRRKLGDDDGCFESALLSVLRFGGVLEHPEASHAFAAFGIPRPHRLVGWEPALVEWKGYRRFGWVCCVEQGHYGHPARKATWLFCTRPYEQGMPPELIWSPSVGRRLDEGFHSAEERKAARAAGVRPTKRLSHNENVTTPVPFRDLLLSLAREAKATRAATDKRYRERKCRKAGES